MTVPVEKSTVHTMVLCRVVIGRPVVAPNGDCVAESLPGGYDSFCMPSAKSDSAGDCMHEYWIKQTAQILPVYLVTFDFDPVKERKSREVSPSYTIARVLTNAKMTEAEMR